MSRTLRNTATRPANSSLDCPISPNHQYWLATHESRTTRWWLNSRRAVYHADVRILCHRDVPVHVISTDFLHFFGVWTRYLGCGSEGLNPDWISLVRRLREAVRLTQSYESFPHMELNKPGVNTKGSSMWFSPYCTTAAINQFPNCKHDNASFWLTASNTPTLISGFSVNRLARVKPAVPAPTMTSDLRWAIDLYCTNQEFLTVISRRNKTNGRYNRGHDCVTHHKGSGWFLSQRKKNWKWRQNPFCLFPNLPFNRKIHDVVFVFLRISCSCSYWFKRSGEMRTVSLYCTPYMYLNMHLMSQFAFGWGRISCTVP